MKILNIQRRPFKGAVYNFATPPLHTYVANGVVVHNCYQASTPKGEHANRNAVEDVLRTLGSLRVFEVAFGGGEPTLYPDFVGVLEHCRYYGIVPNFTTRNLTWMHDSAIRTRILNACGAFAVSVDGEKPDKILKQLRAFCDLHEIDSARVNIQAVEGTVSYFPLFHACAKYEFRLTLLGYKNVGRGATAKPSLLTPYNDWVKTLKDMWKKEQYLCLGIDTAWAKKYEAQLKELEISPKLYETDEGKFSMYIDAVSMRAGPSSYCDPALMVDIQPKAESILEAFRKW